MSRGLVRYHGLFYGPTGYSAEAHEAIRSLDQAGYDVRLVPHGRSVSHPRALDYPTRSLLERLAGRRGGHPAPPGGAGAADLGLYHLPPFMLRLDPDEPLRVGRTMLETDTLPGSWARACLGLDEVWVPSTFNAAAFKAAGFAPDRVRVVPIGVDCRLFRPGRRGSLPFVDTLPIAGEPWLVSGKRPAGSEAAIARAADAGASAFRFLSVFAWQRRKGWDLLLQAYLGEFEAGEPVVLILKVQPASIRKEVILRKLRTYVRDRLGRRPEECAPILAFLKDVRPDELACLYRASDSFVLPSRGEGFGRPYLEAMASGLPVIGTAWSGNLDFMTDANSYLLDVEGLEPVPDGAVYGLASTDRGGGGTPVSWARPSVAHLRRLMRRVYARRAEAAEKASAARADALLRWDTSHTSSRLNSEVARILAKR